MPQPPQDQHSHLRTLAVHAALFGVGGLSLYYLIVMLETLLRRL